MTSTLGVSTPEVRPLALHMPCRRAVDPDVPCVDKTRPIVAPLTPVDTLKTTVDSARGVLSEIVVGVLAVDAVGGYRKGHSQKE